MDNEIHTDPQDIELTIVESSLLQEPAEASQLPAPSVDLPGSHPAGCPPSILSSPARRGPCGLENFLPHLESPSQFHSVIKHLLYVQHRRQIEPYKP